LFATGLSGIVAEYNLSSLASYFIGDSVIQWTLIVSTMLFSMGLGSRLSRKIEGNLAQKFIYIEFILSLLVAFSSLISFIVHSYSTFSAVAIYGFSILIGLLIGMEIPIVIRMNEKYETLKMNVSAVIEKDYYGSLAGGVFFAFVGLPFLGLIHTPYLLGAVNFVAALLVFKLVWKDISDKLKKVLIGLAFLTGTLIVGGWFLATPVILHAEQKRYKDKVVFSAQSKYQKIVITEWKDDYWLYLNGNQQLCSMDEQMYHEPLVHPAMFLAGAAQNVLVLGGGDGCAVREILKHESVKSVTLADLDPAMTDLAMNNKYLTGINLNSLSDSRVKVVNADGFHFLETDSTFYDVIIVDLPDPRTVEVNRLYTTEFYMMCHHRLRPNGLFITQSGSPYFATRAFNCIKKTVRSAGFSILPIHNQVVTMGEWGWVIGAKNTSEPELKQKLKNIEPGDMQLRFLNKEAFTMISSFGKDYVETDTVEVNQIHNPVLYRYYLKGNWDLY